MSVTGAGLVEHVRILRDAYGDDIVLYDELNVSVSHRIVAEFRYGGAVYAVLQSEQLKKEHDVAIFKVSIPPEGDPELESIEDDDEWETVSELYDDMSFPGQDRP